VQKKDLCVQIRFLCRLRLKNVMKIDQKIFDLILSLGVASMRPKPQYGEEADSMSLDSM
jgi:hypothetical protein